VSRNAGCCRQRRAFGVAWGDLFPVTLVGDWGYQRPIFGDFGSRNAESSRWTSITGPRSISPGACADQLGEGRDRRGSPGYEGAVLNALKTPKAR